MQKHLPGYIIILLFEFLNVFTDWKISIIPYLWMKCLEESFHYATHMQWSFTIDSWKDWMESLVFPFNSSLKERSIHQFTICRVRGEQAIRLSKVKPAKFEESTLVEGEKYISKWLNKANDTIKLNWLYILCSFNKDRER